MQPGCSRRSSVGAHCALDIMFASRRTVHGVRCPAVLLKEHRYLERRELLTCGLHGITKGSGLCDTVKVPRSGVGRCASGMFLRSDRRLVTFSTRPCTPHLTNESLVRLLQRPPPRSAPLHLLSRLHSKPLCRLHFFRAFASTSLEHLSRLASPPSPSAGRVA